MITGKIHSWIPDFKFSQNPQVSIRKQDFPLNKIQTTNSNRSLQKRKNV